MSEQDRTVGPAPVLATDATDATTIPSDAPPPGMTPEEIEQARQQAMALVAEVQRTSGSRQLAVLDEVGSVGLTSQRNAARQLELVKTSMATLLDESGVSRDVGGGLVELRSALDQINPNLQHKGLWARTAGALPFLRDNLLVRRLKKIAVRYEPVSKQIVVIETKLREGRSLLLRDNVELRRLYEDVESQQGAVERQIFLGEILLRELERIAAESSDPLQRNRIQAAAHDVGIRLQDLRTMQEVHLQYFVSIELARSNNNRLGQAVDRTLTLATNVVTVGLAIQAALIRQKRVQEATERTRQFLGEMIAQNAAAIRQQTDEIGDLYNQPVIAMDTLQQAHEDLLAALDAASRLREEGITTAKENIVRLTTLTRELSAHVDGLSDDEGHRP